MKKIQLHIKYPVIFEDWNINKNISYTNLKKDKRKPYWWKCKNEHSYKVSIYSRIRSNGCKLCGKTEKSLLMKKKLAIKRGSVLEIRPELRKEWDFEKNKIDPRDLTIGSNVKVWWKCFSCNYEWEMSVKARKKSNCIKCRKKEIVKEKQISAVKKRGVSLFEEYPLLMKEWDFVSNEINPNEISSGSSMIVGWICKFQHKWDAKIYNRTGNESGCPNCRASTSKLEVFFLCELKYLFKTVSWRKKYFGFECDIFIDDIGVGIEIDGGYWHKEKIESDTLKTKTFKANNIKLYRVRENNLPQIIGETISFSAKEKKIDIFLNFLNLFSEKYSILEFNKYIIEKKQKGIKEYKKILSHLPAPANGETLSYRYPKLVREWDLSKNHPLKPEMFAWSSNSKVHWICEKCKYEWEASINNRTKKKPSGCKSCYEKKLSETLRENLLSKKGISFADEYPNMIQEWDFHRNDYTPDKLLSNSSVTINFKCIKGHRYEKSLKAITNSLKSNIKTPCPICYKDIKGENLTRQRIKKDGSLKDNYPKLCEDWSFKKNLLKPTNFHSGSDKEVFWECKKNHTYEARINARVKGIGLCPECKSINHIHPNLMKEWDFSKNIDFDSKKLKPKSKQIVWWKCKNNHSVQSTIVAKTKSGICQECKSISHLHPELMKEWDFSKNKEFDSKSLAPGSKKVVWWKCKENGHDIFRQMIVSRVSGKRGCKVCVSQNYLKD
tara:strand:+ start:1257 stop:3425 length:2169 start_codon:yes stop_codon:yes gene_type:complete